MTDSSHFFGPPQDMAGYDVYSNMDYERLREMCSDWVSAQQQYKKCSRCPSFADAEYEMAEVDGELICWECIRELAEKRVEGIARLFGEIGRIR